MKHKRSFRNTLRPCFNQVIIIIINHSQVPAPFMSIKTPAVTLPGQPIDLEHRSVVLSDISVWLVWSIVMDVGTWRSGVRGQLCTVCTWEVCVMFDATCCQAMWRTPEVFSLFIYLTYQVLTLFFLWLCCRGNRPASLLSLTPWVQLLLLGLFPQSSSPSFCWV